MTTLHKTEARELRLGRLFVSLADTLVTDFDLDDLLQTLVDETTSLLEVESAAIFLARDDGSLGVAAGTSPKTRAVETLVLEGADSPCLDAYRQGLTVGVHDINLVKPEWKGFADILRAGGFRSSHAIPMKLRNETIGVLNLFADRPYTPTAADAALADTITHAATIALIQYRHRVERAALTDQLQEALNSRIIIEQAKGVVAQTRSVDVDDAFKLIRNYARQNRTSLQQVCRDIVERRLNV